MVARTIPLLFLVLSLGALEDPTARLKAIDQEAVAKKAAYLRSWFAGANLTPIPAPKLGADPRASEMEAAQAAERVNDILANVRAFKTGPEAKEDSRLLGAVNADTFKAIIYAETLRKSGPAALAGNR